MKKLKNIEEDNKKQLYEYLSDFHIDKKHDMLDLFTEDDFKCGYFVFCNKMKRRINMPKIGKSALNYWIARGYSEDESENKRVKIKKDPKTSPK